MKTSGYNFQDLEEENKKIDSMLNIEGELDMIDERPKKKKIKYDFSHLFQKPKGEKNMGMDDFGDRKAFEGII